MTGKPRLRVLEAFPVEHQGQRCVALRDPAGFTDQIAVLPPALLDLVSLFDGDHSVEQIREILQRRHGRAPSAGQIGEVIGRFDAAGFLDSEGFRQRRRDLEDTFRRSPVRAAAHAGGAYAGEASALAAQIDGFFNCGGPDMAPALPQSADTRGLRALVSPHIDFHRGGSTYAWAYREVLARSDADLYIVLGTCHAGMAVLRGR